MVGIAPGLMFVAQQWLEYLRVLPRSDEEASFDEESRMLMVLLSLTAAAQLPRSPRQP
jgi:hypothetical protein